MSKVNNHNVNGGVVHNANKGKFDVGANGDTLRDLILQAAKAGKVQEKDDANVSNKLLLIAKHYQDAKTVRPLDGERDELASERFRSVCELEEVFIKSPEAGDLRCEKLPRCWTQAKSNIKAAIEYGLNLGDYNSESALRKDVIKARGMKPSDPIKAGLKGITDALTAKDMPRHVALDLIKNMEGAIAAALQGLVGPVAPVKAEEKAA